MFFVCFYVAQNPGQVVLIVIITIIIIASIIQYLEFFSKFWQLCCKNIQELTLIRISRKYLYFFKCQDVPFCLRISDFKNCPLTKLQHDKILTFFNLVFFYNHIFFWDNDISRSHLYSEDPVLRILRKHFFSRFFCQNDIKFSIPLIFKIWVFENFHLCWAFFKSFKLFLKNWAVCFSRSELLFRSSHFVSSQNFYFCIQN